MVSGHWKHIIFAFEIYMNKFSIYLLMHIQNRQKLKLKTCNISSRTNFSYHWSSDLIFTSGGTVNTERCRDRASQRNGADGKGGIEKRECGIAAIGFIYLPVCMPVFLSTCLPVYLPIYRPIGLSTCMCVCLHNYFPTSLFVHLSVCTGLLTCASVAVN